ncbi:MAG: RpiB/LacA/LacB family sugar-phosphate isomerase [Ignavibacteriaceae bacterium]
MKIAVGSDMKTHLTDVVVDELRKKGHDVEIFGALVKEPALWSRVAVEVAEKVSTGEYDQAVLFCWTGTGISLAANKVMGIRAALCHDAETASGARKWNDANILAMSLRAVSEQVAKEILEAWFSTSPSTDPQDLESLKYLNKAEKRFMIPLKNHSKSKSEKE